MAFFGYLAVDIFSIVSIVGGFDNDELSGLSLARVIFSMVQSIVQVNITNLNSSLDVAYLTLKYNYLPKLLIN